MVIHNQVSHEACYDIIRDELRELTGYNVYIPKSLIPMRMMHRYLINGMGKCDDRSILDRAKEIRRFQRVYHQRGVLYCPIDGSDPLVRKVCMLYPSVLKSHKEKYEQALQGGPPFNIRDIYLVVLISYNQRMIIGRYLSQCHSPTPYRIYNLGTLFNLSRPR